MTPAPPDKPVRTDLIAYAAEEVSKADQDIAIGMALRFRLTAADAADGILALATAHVGRAIGHYRELGFSPEQIAAVLAEFSRGDVR